MSLRSIRREMHAFSGLGVPPVCPDTFFCDPSHFRSVGFVPKCSKQSPDPGFHIAVSWYKNLSRREFIQLAAATAAAGATTSCSGIRSPWRFLRVSEARTLAAICDQLIPPDDDPGASWAQVVNFMDIQLCGPYRVLRALYREGIAHLDENARAQSEKPFAELNDDQQFRLLSTMERGTAPKTIWKTLDPRWFFETVLAHSMQGFYGDPRHGGNRAHASWKMVGLSYPPVRGRLKYDVRAT